MWFGERVPRVRVAPTLLVGPVGVLQGKGGQGECIDRLNDN